ncbi:MAG: hypothetical protein R3B68_03730 [Phycisphaerales bacterium]
MSEVHKSAGGVDGRPARDSDVRPVLLKPACLCLRHKMMYADERQAEPGMVDDSSDTRVYFCVKSQDSLGPDGKAVHPSECTGARGCFKKA